MVEIHFKTFLPLAAPSSWVVITAQSAPIGAVRSQVVRRGAVIRGVLSVQWSTCHSFPQAAGSAGEWPATTAAPGKAGVLTRLLSVCAKRFRVSHRPLDLDRRWLQDQHHDSRQVRIVASVSAPNAFGFTEWSRREPSDIDGQVAKPSEQERPSQTRYNKSPTNDFSSFNSATDASIFARLNSLSGSLCTISHFPPRTRTGNDEIKPFSTP